MDQQQAFIELFGEPVDLTRLTALQNEAVDHFYRMYVRGSRGAILSTPTGTGKTRVGALLADRVLTENDKLDGAGNLCLWITTKNALYNTRREILRWLPHIAPKDVVAIDGSPAERAGQLMQAALNQARFIVAGYDTVVDELPFYQNLMSVSRRNVIVIDEADAIQNPTSHTSIGVRALCKRLGFAMTATPVSNRSNSIWALLDFTNPGGLSQMKEFQWNDRFGRIPVRRFSPSKLWDEYNKFIQQFCTFSERGYINGSRNMQELHRRLVKAGLVEWDKYAILGIKKYIAHTPMLNLTPDQTAYYQARSNGIIQWVEQLRDGGENTDEIWQDNELAIVTGMKRASSVSPIRDVSHALSSRLGIPLDMNAFKLSYDNAKADWVANFIRQHWQEGVFVWSQWEDTLKDVSTRIQSLKSRANTTVLDASVSTEGRLAIQDAVQSGKTKVLLSTPAGGASLNFHALTHAIIFDPPWRHRDVMQAIGRIERAGMQKERAQVWFPVMNQTIETARLIKVLDVKNKDAHEALTGKRGHRNAVMFDDIDDFIASLNHPS